MPAHSVIEKKEQIILDHKSSNLIFHISTNMFVIHS